MNGRFEQASRRLAASAPPQALPVARGEPAVAWQSKETDANRSRHRHIEEVLARKKQDARASASEEARKQAAWDERKRIREEEEKAAASGVKPKSAQEKLQDPVNVAISESKWDRLMNGGGKRKKTKRAPAAAEAASSQGADARGGGSSKKPGEDGVSVRAACAYQLPRDVTRASPVARSPPKPLLCAFQVDETNRMRAALGMAPLQ